MKNSKVSKLKLDSFEVLSKQVQRSIIGGDPYSGGSGSPGNPGGGTPPRSLHCSNTTTPNGGTPWVGGSGRDYYTQDYCCTVVYGGNYNNCITYCNC